MSFDLYRPIRLSEKMAGDFLKNLLAAVEGSQCDPCDKPGEGVCADRVKVEADFRKILQDGEVGLFEAPRLYAMLAMMRGDLGGELKWQPGYLTAAVLKNLAVRAFSLLTEDRENFEEILGSAQTLNIDIGNIILRGVLLGDKTGIWLFSPDQRLVAAIRENLGRASRILREMTRLLEDYRNRLLEEELSLSNFFRARNLYGLSTYITGGVTFTSVEYNGVERFLNYLSAARTAVAALDIALKAGRTLEPDQLSAMILLGSPLRKALSIDVIFLGNSNDDRRELAHNDALVMSDFVRGAASFHADFFAITLLDRIRKSLHHREAADLEGLLPGGFQRWMDEKFVPVADALVSPDALALLPVGGWIGKILGKGAAGFKAASASHSVLRGFKYLIPGVPLFASGAQRTSRAVAVLKGVTNMTAEFGRAYVYISQIRSRLGDGAAEWFARIYMLVAAAVSIFEITWRARAVSDLVSDSENQFLDDLATQGSSTTRVRILRRALDKMLGPERAGKLLAQRRKMLDDAAKEARRVQHRMESVKARQEVRQEARQRMLDDNVARARARLEKLVAERADMFAPPDLYAARSFLDGLATQDSLLAMQRLVAKIEGRIGQQMVRVAAARRSVRSASTDRAVRGGRGGKKRAGYNDTRPPQPAKEAPTPAATGEQSILVRRTIQPPEELLVDEISLLTDGKVVISNGVRRLLADVYQRETKLRAAFWRCFRRLSEDDFAEMVKLEREAAWRAKVGDYRLIFIKEEIDGITRYRITQIKRRGQVKGWRER